MKQIQSMTMQTPIEIALGIDENGMTTAKKLFDFLGMSVNNYSRWFKSNITDNEFAEENADYFLFLTNEEHKGHISQDAKLTAAFAKKLSMQQKNERGEQARQYFVKVEDKAKDMVLMLKEASSNPMKLLELHYQALKEVDGKVNALSDDLSTVRRDLEDFKNDMPILGIEESKITNAVRKKGVQCLGGKESNAYQDRSLRGKLYADLYGQLYRNFGVKSYLAIKRNQTETAITIIQGYTPPLVLAETIETVNAQLTFSDTENQDAI